MIAPAQSKSIIEAINEAQQNYMKERIFRSRWKSIRASGLDDVCNRRIFYYMTCGELADEMTTDLVSIFEEGKDQEPGVRRFLSELGFEVKKSGFNENWNEFNISGSIDGVLEYGLDKYIVEIKTVSDFAWESLYTAEDFKEGFYRKWYGQMQIYLLLFQYERGLFILKRKSAKQIRIIEIELNYEYAEGLLKKAEVVNKALKESTPPDFIKNPIECRKCPFFGKVCNPIMDFGDAIVNIEDPVIAEKLKRREELAAARAEYEKLDKELKDRFKEIPDVLCGDYHITGKESVMKLKAQEEREIKTWRTKIERINATQEV